MKKRILISLLFLLLLLSGCGSEKGQKFAEETIPESTAEDYTLSNAVELCQFVKDCQAEPDSFQLHGLSHIEENGQHYYYLDYSFEVKSGEMERSYFFAEFEGPTLLCIVHERSAIFYETQGEFTETYAALSAKFRENSGETLDGEWILENLK